MTSLILFDFDDTLADTERYMTTAFYERLVEILAPYHAPVNLQEMMVKNTELFRVHGSSLHGWMHELGQDMEFTLEMFRLMAPAIREAVIPHLVRDEGLIARLKGLQEKGYTLAILTLGHRDYCLPLLEILGLDGIFPDEMVFDVSVMEGRLKRDVETFKHLLEWHLPGKFERKIMFEDSLRNLMAAHKAGFETVLVGGKHPPHELDSSIDYHFAGVVEAFESGKLGL
jgi:FMN phosphatase YigB (HAD superfamily)